MDDEGSGEVQNENCGIWSILDIGMLADSVAGEPTDVRYYAVAYSNKLDQRRTLSQRSAVVPTPINILFLNINIIYYLYHKYLYLYHIIYILYSKPRLMTITSYGQAVTSASRHHLATSVLLLPYRTLRSWSTGAWEPWRYSSTLRWHLLYLL